MRRKAFHTLRTKVAASTFVQVLFAAARSECLRAYQSLYISRLRVLDQASAVPVLRKKSHI